MTGRNPLGPYRGLRREIWVLAAANAVTSLGNFVWPMTALLLSGPLGLNKEAAGLFLTLTLLAAVPGALAGGKLADQVGGLSVFVASRVLTGAVAAACAWLIPTSGASSLIPWLLVAGSAARAVGEPVIVALTGNLARVEQRPAAFSLLYLGNKVGFLAPLAAGFLFRRHLVWVFLGYAGAAFLAASLAAALVRTGRRVDGRMAPRPAEEAPAAERRGVLSLLLHQPSLLVFAALLTAYSLVHVQHLFGLPLQLEERYGAAGAGLYGSLISLNSLAGLVLTAGLTGLTARWPAVRNLRLAGLLYAVGFGMVGLDLGRLWLASSTVAWTAGEILVVTNSQAYLMARTPPSHRGRAMALLPLLTQGGYAFGPWLTGWLVERAGVSVIWPAVALLAAAAAMAMRLAGRERLPAR